MRLTFEPASISACALAPDRGGSNSATSNGCSSRALKGSRIKLRRSRRIGFSPLEARAAASRASSAAPSEIVARHRRSPGQSERERPDAAKEVRDLARTAEMLLHEAEHRVLGFPAGLDEGAGRRDDEDPASELEPRRRKLSQNLAIDREPRNGHRGGLLHESPSRAGIAWGRRARDRDIETAIGFDHRHAALGALLCEAAEQYAQARNRERDCGPKHRTLLHVDQLVAQPAAEAEQDRPVSAAEREIRASPGSRGNGNGSRDVRLEPVAGERGHHLLALPLSARPLLHVLEAAPQTPK